MTDTSAVQKRWKLKPQPIICFFFILFYVSSYKLTKIKQHVTKQPPPSEKNNKTILHKYNFHRANYSL